MHNDFFVAALAMTVLTLLAYRVGEHCLLHRPRLDTQLFLGVVSLAFLFAWGYLGRLSWAHRMPTPSAMYWSNFTPILLAFAAGLAGHAVGVRQFMRPWIAGLLMTLAVGYLIVPLARPILFPLDLAARSQWRNEVCLQTHSSSCAPAAAATLLAQHGIRSSEADLAMLCLTSSMGTEPLGLFRGLSNFATLNDHRAIVADKNPDVWFVRGQLPNVALVQFDRVETPGIAPGYFGRQQEGHVVVVLGPTHHGSWRIADPAIGLLTWSDAEFRERFTGDAIYLAASPR